MTTMYFDIDEATAEAVRQKAHRAGKTPAAWIADIVHQQTALTDDAWIENADQLRNNTSEWVKDFLAATEHPKGDSGGWKFNREEIYDR